MATSTPSGVHKTSKGKCWPARIIGIIGMILGLWAWGYSVGALQENSRELPGVILIGLMIIGGLIDCIRVGREGIGGLIVVGSGIVFYMFLFLDWVVLKRSYSPEAQRAALIFTIILFLSGILFYLCGRRRGKE